MIQRYSMFLRLLGVLVLVSLVKCQNETTSASPPVSFSTTPTITTTTQLPPISIIEIINSLVELKFRFKEEKIPAFLAHIITNEIDEYNITVANILKLSKLKDLSMNETVALLAKFDIYSDTIFSINSLEKLLNATQMSFVTFYDALKRKINTDGITIMKVLNDLHIDEGKFSISLTYGIYNIYDVLRNGSYTDENVENALSTLNITRDVLFANAQDVIINEVIRWDPEDFIDMLKDRGFNENTALELWQGLNITTNDVYEVERFRTILGDFVNNLNRNTSVGVFTNNSIIAIHSNIYEAISHQLNLINVRAQFVNEDIAHPVIYHHYYNPNVVLLNSLTRSVNKFIRIENNYPNISRCTYVTLNNNNNLTAERVDVVGIWSDGSQIVAKRNIGTIFNPGSPLICNHKLSGFARSSNVTTIIFDTVYKNADMVDEPITASSQRKFVLREWLMVEILLGALIVALLI